MTEKSSPDQANRLQKLGLFGEIERKFAKLVNAYLYLPFFLLIIITSNGNDIETKAECSFDLNFVCDIEAK
jgi:hypothetical protein